MTKDTLTLRQKLILFLISYDGFNDQYRLDKLLDRADFPSELGKNLPPLLMEELICVIGFANNGAPFKYELTEKGKKVLAENAFRTEVLNYIKTMQEPTFLLQVTAKLMDRENG